MKQEKHFGLRIDEILLKELHYVCEYEGRSVNAQILYLIRRCISDFKIAHGEIDISLKTDKER